MKLQSIYNLIDIIKNEDIGGISVKDKAKLIAYFTEIIFSDQKTEITNVEKNAVPITDKPTYKTDEEIENKIISYLKEVKYSSLNQIAKELNIQPYNGPRSAKVFISALMENGTILHNGGHTRLSKYYLAENKDQKLKAI